MAYKSQYIPVRFQATSTGRPREANDSELQQISNALSNFNQSFSNFTSAYKKEQQNEAQDVFDNLKAQGITDPEEIKKLIDKNDPRTEKLKGYYNKAIVDANFGLSHAIEDFNNINAKVTNITGDDDKSEAMATLDVDSLFQTEDGNPLRNLDTQNKSYTRAYTDSMNKMRLELDSKVSVAKGLKLNRETNAATFQIIAKAWEQGKGWTETKAVGPGGSETETIIHPSTRVQSLEELRKNKVVDEKFVNKDNWNKQVLDYFEQVVNLKNTGLITDPQSLTEIVTYLTMKRGKNGELPSYLRTPNTQEQATKIITAIKGKLASSSKLALGVDLISKGQAYKKDEVAYVNKDGETKIGLSDDDIKDSIISWEKTILAPYVDDLVAKGEVSKELKEFTSFQLTQKMLDSNGIQHPTWKNEIEMGFDSINVIKVAGNKDTIDPDNINIFDRGFQRYQQLRAVYGDKVPTKYVSTEASTYYEIVNNLMRNTSIGKERAMIKAYEAVNNPTLKYADLKMTKSEIYENVQDKFDKWFDEGVPWFEGILFVNKEDTPDWVQTFLRDREAFDWDSVDMTLVTQRATSTASAMIAAGMKKEEAIKFAIEEVATRHTLINGVLVNNSAFPDANPDKLSAKSQEIAKKFESVWIDEYKKLEKLDGWFNQGDIPLVQDRKGDLKYYADDLVMRPFKSGLLVLTEKDSQLPVMTPNGNFVIVSTGDFIDGNVEDMMKKDKRMKVLIENAATQKKNQSIENLKVNK
jgi:uncharacterized protein YfkK (UPF0435 family)